MIEGKCPVCRRVFKVEDRYAGMAGRCKTCGAEIHVPGRLDEGLDGLKPAPAPAPQAAPRQEEGQDVPDAYLTRRLVPAALLACLPVP